jgi:glycosyltransferase involved in cell wall biosynthesis
MRLLQAMAGARHGGAETFFQRLVVGLSRAGIDQRVLTRANAARTQAFRRCGIDPVELRFGGPWDQATRRRFRQEVADYRPDVVLTWMNRATAFCPAPARRLGFVHVGTPRGYYDPKYYRRCDHLICATDDLKRFYLDRGWPRERVSVIPNFVSPAIMPAVPRRELATPEDAPLLLALGRLHENKAFDVLLEALARLPDHWLWLGGAGPLEPSLKADAERLGIAERVRFLGWRDDTPALFAAADLFVCSSRHEPFGNVVIEAWAQGVPVVAAESQGPGHLISTGVDGLLVPVDDARALAEAVRAVSADKDLAARLAGAGRAKQESDYSEAVVVGKFAAFFEHVARAAVP